MHSGRRESGRAAAFRFGVVAVLLAGLLNLAPWLLAFRGTPGRVRDRMRGEITRAPAEIRAIEQDPAYRTARRRGESEKNYLARRKRLAARRADRIRLLRVSDLAIRFGGVQALRDVTFDIEPGELLGLIGPNGAGKTTVFNCLNGIYRPEAGSISLDGQELIGLRPSRIASLGLARTFQHPALFTQLDVLENMMLGRHHGMRTGLLSAVVWFGRARREEVGNLRRCREIAEFLDLDRYAGRPVGELAYGVQKRIEVGRALALEPKLLLLDEPVAGMSPAETDEMAELILDIQEELRIAMILVEHDMHLVMDLAERVVALDFGELLAAGTPAEVAAHHDVITSYLGST